MKRQKLSKDDLIAVKSFYESEYNATLSKLKHLKSILVKLKNVGPPLHSSENTLEILPAAKPKSKRGRPAHKVAKPTVTKIEPRKTRAKKTVAAKPGEVKEKTARKHITWSDIILEVLIENKRAMTTKEIVTSCLKKKGVTDIAQVKRASNIISTILYKLKSDTKVVEAKAKKGSKRKAFTFLPA